MLVSYLTYVDTKERSILKILKINFENQSSIIEYTACLLGSNFIIKKNKL